MTGSVAAVVLAAGLSSRMGEFKPLLPLGGCTALERSVTLFQRAGIRDVRVVTGHRSEELAPIITRLCGRIVGNPRYRDGMFTSVAAGVGSLESGVEAFFVLPVDLPLVRPSTIERLLHAFRQERADVVYPVFMGERGHPPLIAGRLARDIAGWQGHGGLRGALAQFEKGAVEVEVADELILRDMDTPDDYLWLRERANRLQVPTATECRALLEKVLRVDERIIRHGREVARLAVELGAQLNRSGGSLDLQLLAAAGLLHDLARHEPDHAPAGARLLQELGFDAVAELVASHMDIAFSGREPISEAPVLYLADKLVCGERRVPLTERFSPVLERHAGNPEIIGKVRGRLLAARLIQERLESMIGHPVPLTPQPASSE